MYVLIPIVSGYYFITKRASWSRSASAVFVSRKSKIVNRKSDNVIGKIEDGGGRSEEKNGCNNSGAEIKISEVCLG